MPRSEREEGVNFATAPVFPNEYAFSWQPFEKL